MNRLATAIIVTSFVASCAAGCGGSQGPAQSASTASVAAGASEVYTPPPEGTSSLVQSVAARRDTNGQVIIEGRLLLPSGARLWVELFPEKATAGGDPIGRSELYLESRGVFAAGPFNLPPATYRVQLTSHFNRGWQSPEVLSAVGLNGVKLPNAILKPLNPTTPQSGGYLDHVGLVTVR